METIRKRKKSIARVFIMALLLLTSSGSIQHAVAGPPPPENKKIKIGLMLDTSSSMNGLIDQAKSQLWKIVNELSGARCDGQKPDISIALYEYGNSGLTASNGYIRQVTPLTNDLDQISKDLFALTTNGGDEYCGQVIQTGTRELNWGTSSEDLKMIFIAGNESFNQGLVPYSQACSDAKEKGIIVNTIFCGNFDVGVSSLWKNGADLTGGTYMSIEQNRKTVYIPSPYDSDITKLNSELNDTYIQYGQEGHAKKMNQTAQDANSSQYGQENMVSRIVSKSSHVYNNASWDIVDKSNEKDFDINKIENKFLPDNMQKMTAQEKIDYIDAQKAKREELKEKITDLNVKRTTFVENKKKAMGTAAAATLDAAMILAIKKQAKAKKFIFEKDE